MSTNPPGSKIGWPAGQVPDPNRTSPMIPSADQGSAETRTFVDTYFTQVPDPQSPSSIVYNGERQWARVTLTLETAGPVVIGTMADLSPMLSGKGALLDTGVPKSVVIAKGTRLYILATGINRVKREIEPLPWGEQIAGLILGVSGGRR